MGRTRVFWLILAVMLSTLILSSAEEAEKKESEKKEEADKHSEEKTKEDKPKEDDKKSKDDAKDKKKEDAKEKKKEDAKDKKKDEKEKEKDKKEEKEELERDIMTKEEKEESLKEEAKAEEENLPEHDRKGVDKYILGTFELVTDPKEDDFNDFLKAMEFSDKDRNSIRHIKHVEAHVTKKGEKYTLWIRAGFVNVKNVYQFGKEFDDKLFDGRKYSATINHEGHKRLTRDEKYKGFTARHEAVYTENGFTVTYTAKGKSAVQEFKRKRNNGGALLNIKLLGLG